MGSYIHDKNHFPQLANYILLVVPFLVLLPELGGAPPKRSYCDDCRKPQDDLPFYCGIQPDLPQCNSPICPKICEVIPTNPPSRGTKATSPTPPTKRHRRRHNNRSKVHGKHVQRLGKGRPLSESRPRSGKRKKGIKLATYVSLGRTKVGKQYNPVTCELNSPNLKRLRSDSKYIEYRSPDSRYQIQDIYETAKRYGLVMAEFRHLIEWWTVEQSSIMETVSTYDMTPKQPRIYYAIGVKEEDGRGSSPEGQPAFKYLSGKSSVTFAVMDPSGLVRSDEKCAVLTHVMGSDKRQHLTTRLVNCNASLGDGDGTSVTHGLFMFPPGSICYRRSGEECGLLEQIQSGADKMFHNMIEIGQTIKRFIYLYTDQMTWSDSKAFCEAKGLHLLDLNHIWEDGPEVAEVIEHFLREGKLNPTSMFWTSGRFENSFIDGKFRWATTNSEFSTSHNHDKEPSEVPISWWDDDDHWDELKDKPDLLRRNVINKPCIALALNSENERPKLLFQAWYCNFPMSFLCYKELTAPDKLDGPNPSSKKSRPDPSPDSCEPPPKPGKEPDKDKQNEGSFQPFDRETCTSKSIHVKRVTPNSRFVQYKPPEKHDSIEEIKEHCKRLGLIPAEIRSWEDWDSISKWLVRGLGPKGRKSSTNYNYVIGMDDTKEAGKIRYNSDDGELTFSMFAGDGSSSSNNHRCTVLASEKGHGLVMKHINCKKVFISENEIAYGLCMFHPNWDCYKESDEEIAESKDKAKYTTLIPLGGTDTRDIFFNPVQRNWTGALKFCQMADLQLLDFDEKWNDAQQIRNIFRDKLQKDGGLSPYTPLWTSGKLQGPLEDKVGKWSTTNSPLKFPPETNGYKWPHLDDLHLGQRREDSIRNACVEGSFDDDSISITEIRLRPHYCDLPKYFLCYRKSDKMGGKGSSRHDGITVFLDEPDASDEKDVGGGGSARSGANNGNGRNNKNNLRLRKSKVRLKFRE